MQFYLDGYRPGDPLIEQPHPSVTARPEDLPDEDPRSHLVAIYEWLGFLQETLVRALS